MQLLFVTVCCLSPRPVVVFKCVCVLLGACFQAVCRICVVGRPVFIMVIRYQIGRAHAGIYWTLMNYYFICDGINKNEQGFQGRILERIPHLYYGICWHNICNCGIPGWRHRYIYNTAKYFYIGGNFLSAQIK